MINRILVPLDLSDYAEAATRRACEIAKAHRAQVTGMVVVNTPELMGKSFGLHRLRAQHDQVEAAQLSAINARVEKALGKFCETCDNAIVPFVGDQVEGVPADQLFEAALYYDLAVVGLRTNFRFDLPDEEGLHPIGRDLDRTSTPVLAVPKGEQSPFKNALVAFDGSVNAARTLREFLDFQEPFDLKISVLTQDPDKDRAKYINDQALARVRAAGSHDPEGIVVANRDIIEVYEENFRGKFDLVVAGIHTKHALKDFVIGSFTTSLIEDGRTALFLGQ
jgi:nucleotide-binding universal stress UspA family protein